MPSSPIKKSFLFFLVWVNILTAQIYPSKNFTAANNLPNNSVRALFVDSDNALWIGTENGVVRKENDEFKNFFEEDGLALNSCWAIQEDKNKKLWFGSYGKGLSIFDGNQFTRISTESGLVHNEVTHLFASGNYMYVGTSDGISVINVDTFEVLPLNKPTSSELIRVQGFFKFRNEVFAVTYNTGIFKISKKAGEMRVEKVNEHQYIYSIFPVKDSIYSSNKEFINLLGLEEYTSAQVSSKNRLGTSIIWDYCKTNDQRIFAAAWGIYDTTGGIYEVVDKQLISRAVNFDISSNQVTSLAYDPNFQKLYVGTRDSGLYEVKLNAQVKFHEFPSEKILGFASSKGVNVILSNQGLYLENSKSKIFISLSKFKAWQQHFINTTDLPLPKHEDSFYELDYDIPAGEIGFYDIKRLANTFWINSNIGIFVINESGELDRYLPIHSEEINFTPEGRLVETHPYGGVRVYKNLDRFEYLHYPHESTSTPTMVVNSLRLGDRTYFVSVFSGLYKWENQQFYSLLENDIWNEKKLRHITRLGNKLAISSEFGDVFILDETTYPKVLNKIPRAKIQGNSIAFLNEYKETLLIGTEKGLTLVNNDRFIFINEEQGLKQPFYHAEVKDDHLHIGSDNGYYSLNLPEIIEPKALINNIDLKEININNHKFPLNDISRGETLSLDHDENTVLLRFGTNAHPYPKKLSYQYRLKEESSWSQPSLKPEIFLPFLPPNTYDIDVRVLDSSTGSRFFQHFIQLVVHPPYWKTWWFVLIILILIGTGAFSLYRFQIRQVRNFEEQKGLIQKRFEQTKMEALLSQMNPHFIFNAMNSIQNYILDSDIDRATSFLDDFSRLIRLNLDYCTRPNILLVEEIEYLQSYIRIENTRFDNLVQVNFIIDPKIDQYKVEVPTMIIQPFVENVFVHAFPPQIKSPRLTVEFGKINDEFIQCRIEDNGIGFHSISRTGIHKSKGLSLVKERLCLLGYDTEEAIKITSKKYNGCRVIINLKI